MMPHTELPFPLPQAIMEELDKVSKRKFIMKTWFIPGQYIAADNAVVLIGLAASVGLAIGLVGGWIFLSQTAMASVAASVAGP